MKITARLAKRQENGRKAVLYSFLPKKSSQINKLHYTVTNRKYWKVAVWTDEIVNSTRRVLDAMPLSVSMCKLKTRQLGINIPMEKEPASDIQR